MSAQKSVQTGMSNRIAGLIRADVGGRELVRQSFDLIERQHHGPALL